MGILKIMKEENLTEEQVRLKYPELFDPALQHREHEPYPCDECNGYKNCCCICDEN